MNVTAHHVLVTQNSEDSFWGKQRLMDQTIWDYVYHISRIHFWPQGVASKQFAVMSEPGAPHGMFPKNPLDLSHTSMDSD